VTPNRSLQLLGTRIRRARRKIGLSQEALAFHCGVDRSYMGGIERGERNVSLLKLCSIAEVLGKDIPSLTRGIPVRDLEAPPEGGRR